MRAICLSVYFRFKVNFYFKNLAKQVSHVLYVIFKLITVNFLEKKTNRCNDCKLLFRTLEGMNIKLMTIFLESLKRNSLVLS